MYLNLLKHVLIMERYFETQSLNVETSFDTSQFGEIELMELYVSLERFRDQYPLWGGTTGGTIWGHAIAVDDLLYFGAMDHKVYAIDAVFEASWISRTGLASG